jgi:hypothetical protein
VTPSTKLRGTCDTPTSPCRTTTAQDMVTCINAMRKLSTGCLGIFIVTSATICCTIGDPASPELRALRDIHRLHQAESEYYSRMGCYGNLRELGPEGANLITPELARGRHYSYGFTLSSTGTSYVIRARPQRWGWDTRRSFYSDETAVIHQNWTDSEATPESKRLW